MDAAVIILRKIPAGTIHFDAQENRDHDTREKMTVIIITAMALVVIPSTVT